jgi:hypothetical protein
VFEDCGIPVNILWTAAAPGSAFVSDPTAGAFGVDEPPPERLTASTIATTTATIAAPTAMSTFGDARRAPALPTGGGGTLAGA